MVRACKEGEKTVPREAEGELVMGNLPKGVTVKDLSCPEAAQKTVGDVQAVHSNNC